MPFEIVGTKHVEKRDCVVCAIAIAAGIPYDDAHAVLTQCGRCPRRGTPFPVYRCALARLGFVAAPRKFSTRPAHNVEYKYDSAWRDRPDMYNKVYYYIDDKDEQTTLGRFIEEHPVGRFFVVVNRHALVVVDGKPSETYTGRRSIVREYWRKER